MSGFKQIKYNTDILKDITDEDRYYFQGDYSNKEEEDYEMNPELFNFLVEEIENNEQIDIKHLEEFRDISGFYLRYIYFREFRNSGLCNLLVQNLTSNNTDVQVLMWQIACNLVSNSEITDYADDLIEYGLFAQINFVLQKYHDQEEPIYYCFFCLSNLATLSVSMRDNLFTLVSPDLILFHLQRKETTEGNISIIMKFVNRLMFDIFDDEQFEYIFSILHPVMDEFIRSESQSKAIAQSVFLLSGHPNFVEMMNQFNEFEIFYSLITSTNNAIIEYVIGTTLNIIDDEYENISNYINYFIQFLFESASKKITQGASKVISRLLLLTPLSFPPELQFSIAKFSLQNCESPFSVKKDILNCFLSVVTVAEMNTLTQIPLDKIIQALVDIIEIEDIEMVLKTLGQLTKLFTVQGAKDMFESFDGFEALQSLLCIIFDQDAISAISSFLEMYYDQTI